LSLLQQQAADLFGIELTPDQITAFDRYLQELIAWNAHTNLTAIIEPDEVRVRHYLDSLSIVTVAPLQGDLRLIDIGTGAGFPGMALAIAFPHIHVTLLESTGKKIAFLDHVVKTLGLTNVKTLHARAEEAGRLPHQRASYDLVLARAVARMPALVEYMLPLARVGGRCIAMKGVTAEEETQDASHALQIIGGRLHRISAVQLPEVDQAHYLVVIEKTDATPKAYPRNPGTPTRKPL
jgi:16S rRNA (guanine527-N7)-methyltransferase